MVGDSVRRVRQAEDEAEDIIEAAAEEVERVQASSAQEYSLRILAAKDKARKEGARLRVQTLNRAEEEISAARKGIDWERRMITIKGKSRTDAAVQIVLGILEGFGTPKRDGD